MSDAQLLYILLEALRQWKCPACGGKGTYLNRGFKKSEMVDGTVLIGAKFYNEEVPCTKCNGNGLHPIAAEALLAAGEKL